MSPNLGKSASGDLANPPSSLLDFSKLSTREREKKGEGENRMGQKFGNGPSPTTIQSPLPTPSPKLCSTLEKFSPPPLRSSHVCRRLLSTLYTTELFWFLLTIHTALYTRQQRRRRLFENWSKEEGKSQKGRQPL